MIITLTPRRHPGASRLVHRSVSEDGRLESGIYFQGYFMDPGFKLIVCPGMMTSGRGVS